MGAVATVKMVNAAEDDLHHHQTAERRISWSCSQPDTLRNENLALIRVLTKLSK
jgi:hypothetical protein